ncbi:wall-associated receptor kinase-like 8 [Pistacia vera]|uniref:wall-associated receptor kinase-like 8 n=1 Tax=Pistacia vera TaxID=55513 RepID=UPI001262B5C7|nr:wall-associated receptor kinase-like 8 [Pistacia vera]
MRKAELVFIPLAGAGHLVPEVEFAKRLLKRDDGRFSVTVLLMDSIFIRNVVTHTLYKSLAEFNTPIRFINLPPPVDFSPSKDAHRSIEKYMVEFVDSHKTCVKEAIVKHVCFGVVLVELLTGQKPISLTRSKEGRSLSTYFLHFLEEKHLFDILDAQVVKQGKREEIMAVANIAKRRLSISGKNRPSMKEVAMELEAIRASRKDSDDQQHYHMRTVVIEPWDAVPASTSSTFDNTASSPDILPLLSKKSS